LIRAYRREPRLVITAGAEGRTNLPSLSVLGGKQLPVPLGDDFDVAVGHLDRGLVVDRLSPAFRFRALGMRVCVSV